MKSLLYVLFWLTCSVSVYGVCPESKKEYPGDCRMFYKCVPLPAANRTSGSAHAYFWIPIRCTAGLVFHSDLRKCMPPEKSRDCRNDDQLLHISQILKQNESETNEDATEDDSSTIISDFVDADSLTYADSIILDDAELIQEDIEIITDTLSTPKVTLEPIRLTTNVRNESTIPSYHHSQFALNSKPTSESNVDYIANQMNQILSLVDNLKASNYPPTDIQNQEFQSLKPMHSFNLLGSITVNSPIQTSNLINILANPLDSNQPTTDEPIQINKITAQLKQIKQPNPANTPQTKLNLFSSKSLLHGYPNLNSDPPYFKNANDKNTGQQASMFFNKYLADQISIKTNEAYANPSKYFNTELNMWNNLKKKYDKITGLDLHKEDYFTMNKYKTSVWPIDQVTPANVLPCTTGIRFPNASDCRRYYMCNETSATIYDYTCPPSTAFNRIKRICDSKEYERCANLLAITAAVTMAPTADDKSIVLDGGPERTTDACSAEGTKLLDPMSPNHYFICVLGNDARPKQIRISCPSTLVFCKVRSLCTAHTTC